MIKILTDVVIRLCAISAGKEPFSVSNKFFAVKCNLLIKINQVRIDISDKIMRILCRHHHSAGTRERFNQSQACRQVLFQLMHDGGLIARPFQDGAH